MFPAEFDAWVTLTPRKLGSISNFLLTNIEGEAINRIYEAADSGCEGCS